LSCVIGEFGGPGVWSLWGRCLGGIAMQETLPQKPGFEEEAGLGARSQSSHTTRFLRRKRVFGTRAGAATCRRREPGFEERAGAIRGALTQKPGFEEEAGLGGGEGGS
jgi:hypothetical protein